jgi:adenylate cyclase
MADRPGRQWIRPLRLWCGLILFAYLLTHFSNHALGLVSLGAMEEGRLWFLALWRNPIGETALFGALLTHWLLGLWLLYRRRTLRMPAWEATQIVFGLAVPPLLVNHFVGTRLANAMFGTEDLYTRFVLSVWVRDPWALARQTSLFLIAWTHGCIGLHFWLRLRPWYRRMFPVILSAYVLVPALGYLGFTQAGREVQALARDPGFVQRLMVQTRNPSTAQRATLVSLREALSNTVWGLLVLTFAARGAREIQSRRRATVRISYPGGRSVAVPVGWTVLEASRSAGIPHASVCGGRGRCSTCRIRVGSDAALLPPPSPLELRVLQRVGAPPNVRLACQLRPERDLAVTPLLSATMNAAAPHLGGTARLGQERELAILFADLRGFTRLAEHKLPYDLVFFLNRYFEAVGGAIAEAGGIANQYTGDGVMALFGSETGAGPACRQALRAAGAMVARVDEVSRSFETDLGAPLRIGIGIHVGPAVVGEMGYGETRYFTAVGDTVHVASRLEALTKEYQCELVVSEQVMDRAGISTPGYPRHELTVRNRETPLRIIVVAEARKLADQALAADGIEGRTV